MDIIVTTPKSQMANAAREAADVLAAGGGEYFRRFSGGHHAPKIKAGEHVWYVEDGYIRGCCVVSRVLWRGAGERCETTGREWAPGYYVYMDATTWLWCRPIPMRGFQGYRYVHPKSVGELLSAQIHQAEIVGGWLDPRPANGIEPSTERLTGGDQLTADTPQTTTTQSDAKPAETAQ